MNLILNFQFEHSRNPAIKGEVENDYNIESFAPENLRGFRGWQ